MCALVQAEAYLRVHNAEASTKWSAMTVAFMFSAVTHSGVSRTRRAARVLN